MKTRNIIFIVLGIFLVLAGIILIFNQLGVLSIIQQTTSWVDEESRATWDGVWNSEHPVTNAFDENWGTPTVLIGVYKEANIYEYFILTSPQDSLIDYLEFQVSYSVDLITDVKDAYASVEYYVWNYRVSSWDKIYEDSSDSGGRSQRPFFKASPVDHIQNNEVRLRTKATVGFLQAVWIYESKAKLGYSLDVDCVVDEIKCEGRNYYSCENHKWKNLGAIVGKCGAECLLNANCPSGGYTGEKYCSNDNVVQKYVSYPCIEYQCDYSALEKIIKTCEFGCENRECNITPPPTQPEISGFTQFFEFIKNNFIGIFLTLFVIGIGGVVWFFRRRR